MSRKPEKGENINVSGTKKFARHEGIHRSLKDVLKERQLLAESEGTKLTTKHCRSVSLFEDGTASEYIGLGDWV